MQCLLIHNILAQNSVPIKALKTKIGAQGKKQSLTKQPVKWNGELTAAMLFQGREDEELGPWLWGETNKIVKTGDGEGIKPRMEGIH